jgi:malate synthase
VNELALAKVRDDKERESGDGYDGTWVAHPDLVPVAMEVFDGVLGEAPNQLRRSRDDVSVTARDLLDVRVPGGIVTDEGLRTNAIVGLGYLTSWLRGTGAAAINSLMEDAATAEISRSQIWQWLHHGVALEDGRSVTPELVRSVLDDAEAVVRDQADGPEVAVARELFEEVVMAPGFVEFLTIPAYERL